MTPIKQRVIAVVSLAGLCAGPIPQVPNSGLVADASAADSAVAALAQQAPISKEETNKRLAPAVTVTQARQTEFIESLFLSGTLVAREEVMIGAPLDGLRIVELLAEDGDHVEKGQVLARLDSSQIDTVLAQNDAALIRAEAAIGQARNQIDQFDAARIQAGAELERAKKLDLRIVTQATLDQRIAAARSAEAQFAAAKSALAVAQADKAAREAERREFMVRLDRTEVRAPVAGVISRRTARLGAITMLAGDALFRLLANGAIDLEAEIPEQSLARLKCGMRAKITLPGVDAPVEGHVRLISAEVDKATRIGKVRIALPKEAVARIGSFASGETIIAERQAIAVPSSAVQRMDEGDFVEVVEGDRVTLRKITLGITNERKSEIREGLSQGERVVARATAFLRSGDLIRPIATANETGLLTQEDTK